MLSLLGPPWSLSGPYAPPAMHLTSVSHVGFPAVLISPKSGKSPYCGAHVSPDNDSSSGFHPVCTTVHPPAAQNVALLHETPASCIALVDWLCGSGANSVVHAP